MHICNSCGVELDGNMSFCPLCGLEAGKKPDEPKRVELEKPNVKGKILREIKNLTIDQKGKLFWEISGIILGSAIVVTLLINLFISNNVNWAKYVLIASLGAFGNISAFTLWRKKSFLLITASLVSSVFMLLALDFISFSIGWGARLGVPVVISFYTLLLLVFLIIHISKQLGFNILAVIFIELGLFLICIELFISLYFHQTIILSWSIIAAVSIIPVAAVLFFVHFKLKKGIELKRFFHI